jgi:PII-like signaling protein
MFFDKKRISIIVEEVYRDEVVKLLEESGASGFTVYKDIYGKGKSGVRGKCGGLSEISSNIEIVSITGPEVADRSLRGLTTLINKGVVLIVHMTDVKVIRNDYFN